MRHEPGRGNSQIKGGARGVVVGLAHDTRARVAIAARDEASLRRHAELCSKEYSAVHENANLSAKYERLLRAAAAAGMPLDAQPGAQAHEQPPQDPARTVYSRMLTCVSPAERSEKGLQLLLEATGASAGHLFGLRSGRLSWLAGGDATEPSAALVRTLETFMQHELEDESRGRVTLQPAALASVVDDWGREFVPLVLRGKHRGEAMIAGLVALHYEDDEQPPRRRAMLEAIIDALIAGDIVDPITCVGPE